MSVKYKLKTSALTEWFDVIGKLISEAKFVEAFNKIFEFTTISGNKFFNDEKIWELVKTDKAKADIVMFNSLIVVEAISIMIAPFLPESSEKIRQMLGLGEFGPLVGQDKWRLDTEVLTKYKLESKVEILFAKLEREKVLKEKEN